MSEKKSAVSHELMSKIILESRQIAHLNQKLMEQLHSTHETSRRLKDDVARLSEEFDSLNSDARIKFLEQELGEKDARIKRADERAEEITRMLDGRDSDLNALKDQLSAIRDKISTKDIVIGELGRNLVDKDSEFVSQEKARTDIKSELHQLAVEIDHRNKAISAVHEKVDRLHVELEKKDEKLDEHRQRSSAMEEELDRARTDNDSLRKHLKKFQDNLHILKEDLLIKDRIIHDTQRRHLEKQKLLKTLHKDFSSLQEQIRVLDDTNVDVLKRLAKSDSVISTLDQELAHQKELNRKLELHYSTQLKMNDQKNATRLRALIAESTQRQLRLQTELEILREKTSVKRPEPVPVAEPRPTVLKPKAVKDVKPVKEVESVFMHATPDELVPMIRTALDHGDSTEQIRSSLVTSGYRQEIVDKSIEKISIKKI